jgi:hypothetical protein
MYTLVVASMHYTLTIECILDTSIVPVPVLLEEQHNNVHNGVYQHFYSSNALGVINAYSSYLQRNEVVVMTVPRKSGVAPA